MKRQILDRATWLFMQLYLIFLLLRVCMIGKDTVSLPFAITFIIISVAFMIYMIFVYEKYMNKLHVRIKYFTDDIQHLESVSKGDLIDLRASEDVEMKKGDFKLIPLGVAMDLPTGYRANIYPRSSTYKNFRIIMANSTGIIDSNYNGDLDQWMFPAIALEDTVIHKGDRICQFEIVPVMGAVQFEEVETLDNENRGGIGSTGIS